MFNFGYVLNRKHKKLANLLRDTSYESSKFATRKWYVINNQNNTDYDEGNEDGTTVKFQTIVIVQVVMLILELCLKIVLHLPNVQLT